VELDVKKAVSIFAGFCIVSIFSLFPAIAGEYHINIPGKGQNLNCYDCHTLHFSQDGSAPPQVPIGARPWGGAPQDYLLKNITSEMCLMCHDGTNPEAPQVTYSPLSGSVSSTFNYQSSAGYLGEEKNASDPSYSVFGHTLNSSDPPPGYNGTWEGILSCTRCHDPHGNSYYRNLRPKPLTKPLVGSANDSINDSAKGAPLTYFISTSPDASKDKVIQIAVGSNDSPFLRYDLNKIIYRQEGDGVQNSAGLSFWCAGCHSDFNHDGKSQGPRKLHPTYGISMSEAKPEIRDKWISSASGPPTRPPTITPADTNRGEDRLFCGTCHKAHGSTHSYGLLWENPAASDRESGQYLRDTCQACHNIGQGHYESSPHADPNFGVYRVQEFARGECEHCHQQHGTPRGASSGSSSGGQNSGGMVRDYYEHNLFSANNKFLCLTDGCHKDSPPSYPLSDTTFSDETSKARISIAVVPGSDRAYLGYFEANRQINNTIVRLAGLQYRGRWPGASVYNNEQYSPHGREQGPMPDGGSCLNCHSPHGTESRFDMLKLPYKGTPNSSSQAADNYKLCFSCHSEQGPSEMRPETKRIASYYTLDDPYSGHRIKSANGFAQPGDKLACSNCHNPHGSMGHNKSAPNLHLLSDERPEWSGLKDTLTDPNSSRKFCFGCHVPSDSPQSEKEKWPKVEGIQMQPIPDFAEHRREAAGSCHSCHGGSYDKPDSENVHHPSPGSCDKCHADQGAWERKVYSGPHRFHTDRYAFACEVCHARQNRKAAKATHGYGKPEGAICQYAEVSFCDGSDSIDWKEQVLHKKTYRYRSLYHNPYDKAGIVPGYDASAYERPESRCLPDPVDPNRVLWTDQSTFKGQDSCSNIWCHSNANPLSLPNFPRANSYRANPSFHLTWDEHDTDRCNNCHGFTDLDQPAEQYQLSSYHRKHIVVTTPGKATCGKEKIRCGWCHDKTCSEDSNTIREDGGYSFHVNGVKDVIFLDPNGKYIVDSNTGKRTCLVSCHSRDGVLIPVCWDEPEPEKVCGTCHDVYAGFGSCRSTISTGGHSAHLVADRGPGGPHSVEQCDECHTSHDDPAHSNGRVDFKDGQILAKTTVCNNCHSPGGDYDGVNDPEIGAKKIWEAEKRLGEAGGVYVASGGRLELKESKKKWCVGCHDRQPATSRSDGSGVMAPNIAGDEQAFLVYGRGYGYFVTGHGLEKSRPYPASGVQGAGVSCTDCHEASLGHIDHAHRTYSVRQKDNPNNKSNYRLGYRLKASLLATDPNRPLDIPRTAATGPNNNPQQQWQDFALCFECHDRSALLGNGISSGEYYKNPLQTNFYNDARTYKEDNTKKENLHLTHLTGRGGGGNSLDWTSSWTETGDSAISCPACHNVHGSPSPRMMRHGELISTPGSTDKVPGLNFRYLPYPPSNTVLAESSGGEIFRQFSSGPGSVLQNKICNTCHRAFIQYSRSPYLDPNKVNPQILSVVAHNGPDGGQGINDGDYLTITFTTAINNPEVIQGAEDVKSVIKIYGDSGLSQEKEWTPALIEWSSAGGHSNDTLRIFLQKVGSSIAVGDYLRVLPGKLYGKLGTIVLPIDSYQQITGSFDCALVRAVAENNSQSLEPGIQAGDQVTVYFSGSVDVSTSEWRLTSDNIDQALRLDHDHSWGKVEIKWNEPICDTLTITFGSGPPAPTIAVGDRISLGNIIHDRFKNQMTGSVKLEGSFDALLPISPKGVYWCNIAGPPWGDVSKSIDGDPNTLWSLGGSAEGKISYDLGAQYRVFRVIILSGGSSEGDPPKAVVKVWLTASPEYDPNSPLINSWEIPITPEPHVSSPFEATGRYLRIEATKIGAGPLGPLFHEVQFQGTSALPYASPRIVGVEAYNVAGGVGVDDGDEVVVRFNVSTNGSEVIRGVDDVASILAVYGDADHKAESRKSWGSIKKVVWSDEGGNKDDTLRITLGGGEVSIAAGDVVEVCSSKLKGRVDGFELPIVSSQVIRGSFDCSVVRAVAVNQSQSQDSGIQEGDQVIISFAGQSGGTPISLDKIDDALRLNNGHSWGQVKAIEWSDSNTLIITFGAGSPSPTIAVGDLITLGGVICDRGQHPILGSVELIGSFDPPQAVWRTPEAIHSFSPDAWGIDNAKKSIDNDTTTSWTVMSGTARITYDLDPKYQAQYQVSQLKIFFSSSSQLVKALVKVWVTTGPTYDPDAPTSGPYEISVNSSGWIEIPQTESPQFEAKGRYLTLEIIKKTPGPFGNFIAEVQFKGLAPPMYP